MAVTIHIPLIHRHLSDDVETLQVDGKTVGECFNQLVKRFPNLQSAIFDEKGELQNLLEVYLNSESAYPDELARSTEDGDEIYITTILSGG
jgi:molybdopterin converting factor small subunit